MHPDRSWGRYHSSTAMHQRKIVLCRLTIIPFSSGFSADSGLPVYADIARVEKYASQDKTYADLADISLLVSDPELFLEFWLSCVVSVSEPLNQNIFIVAYIF